MPLKGLIRDIQDIKGIGSISRRNFEIKLSHLQRARSYNGSLHERFCKIDSLRNQEEQGCWASLPSELLRDIIQRIEESESTWPCRRNIVVCAAVCKSWRNITKEIVKDPSHCGKLTFPLSLKQPGPQEDAIQCFIKRDRSTSTYNLYLSLSATLVENGKFLMAAHRVRRTTSTEYIISLDANDISRASSTYVGKLRSNFLGTKFMIYDSHQPHNGMIASTNHAGRRLTAKQVSPRVPAGSYDVADIAYELNVLGTRGPRRMQCTLHSIPLSAMEEGANIRTEFPSIVENLLPSKVLPRSKTSVVDRCFTEPDHISIETGKNTPLILKNKAPRWHEQLQCWCLNFRGRVTVASVKNFQLVASVDPCQQSIVSDPDRVILQFGKIGKDTFTMDYSYPLSAFQAFAICLSSFDTKLACE